MKTVLIHLRELLLALFCPYLGQPIQTEMCTLSARDLDLAENGSLLPRTYDRVLVSVFTRQNGEELMCVTGRDHQLAYVPIGTRCHLSYQASRQSYFFSSRVLSAVPCLEES